MRIYLDNAATSWPKPEGVYSAVDHYLRHVGAPAGRSGYGEAIEASRAVSSARLALARWFGLQDPTHIIFTANGTDSLNLAIHGSLRQGDHVITSVVDHNSVLRPLHQLEHDGLISLTVISCSASGCVDPDDVRKALKPATKLIALSHASNVTGAIQPIAEVGRIAREATVLLLCDAAQSAGHMEIDMEELGVDFLATPGHKGLLGPLGTGVLAIRPPAGDTLRSIRQGGTGTQSDDVLQPEGLPEKLEAGNLNLVGIVGLAAGVEYLRREGQAAVAAHGMELTERLLSRLSEISGVRVLGPAGVEERVPVVSVVMSGYDPQEVALTFDAAYQIQVRPGLHCAPLMHRALGTDKSGGSVRFSMGPFNTTEQIDQTAIAIAEMAAAQATH